MRTTTSRLALPMMRPSSITSFVGVLLFSRTLFVIVVGLVFSNNQKVYGANGFFNSHHLHLPRRTAAVIQQQQDHHRLIHHQQQPYYTTTGSTSTTSCLFPTRGGKGKGLSSLSQLVTTRREGRGGECRGLRERLIVAPYNHFKSAGSIEGRGSYDVVESTSALIVLRSIRGGDSSGTGGTSGGMLWISSLLSYLNTTSRKFVANVGASKTKCWIILVISIVAESFSSILSKYAKEKGSIEIFIAACCVYLLTMFGFNLCLAKIEVGVAYAVWSALGSLIVSTVGILFFGEAYDVWKLTCLLLITIGVVGLNIR